MFVVQGVVMHFALLVSIFIIFITAELLARRGKEFKIRLLPGVEAMEEAVGRCVELGRPVHYTPGYNLGGLYSSGANSMLAGLTILEHVARICARKGAQLVVTINPPEAMPIAEENVRTAYIVEGKDPPKDAVRWISTEQYAFTIGVLSTIQEIQPAANMLIGSFWSEALQFAQAGNYAGAIGIAGATGQLPMFIASMDYMLIGEELFAAQAYVSNDKIKIASIAGQDWTRVLLILIILSIFIASNLGIKIIPILNM